MDTRYVPAAHEGRLFERWLAAGVFGGGSRPDRETYAIALPPPNVTGELHMGHALNGSTQDTLIRLQANAGHGHALDLRHRPRLDRRPRGDRAAAAGGGTDPLGPRSRALPGACVGVAGRDRRDDHPAVQAAGRHARLRPRAVHHGRPLRAGGADDVRRALPQGLHLPRQPADQLVPDLRLDDLRPGGALRARGRHALRGALPDQGHERLPARGHRPPGDDPRRHGRRRAPERRALPAPGRGHGDRPAGQPRGADHRGRVRAHRLRHRRTQGDARPRPQRLRDRPPARPRPS